MSYIVRMEKDLVKFTFITLLFIYGCKNKNTQAFPSNLSSFDKKLENINQAIKEAAKKDSLYIERGIIFLENEKYEEAIVDFMYAWKLDSSHPKALHKLSETYLAYFKSYEALQILKEASKRFPESAETMRQLAKLQLILKQYEEGFRSLERARKIGDGIPETAFLTGLFFKETGDTARAINSLQEAIEGDPDIEDAWIILGQLQEAKGNLIAGKYYESALQRDPNNEQALMAKANFLARNNDLVGALLIFKKMQKLDSQNVDSYFNAGLIYLDLDSIKEASLSFNKAVSLNPLLVEGQYYCGLSAEWLGEFEKARKFYQTALRLAPDYKDPQEGLIRINK
jgi:tetratricopeptide (TPR) repeat protein